MVEEHHLSRVRCCRRSKTEHWVSVPCRLTAFGCRYHDVRAAIDWETWLRRFDDEGVLAEKRLRLRLQ